MPKKTKTPTGKARKLTAEEYRTLAEQAAQTEQGQRRNERVARAKRAVGVPQRRWATDQNVATGQRQERAAYSATKAQRARQRPTGGQLWQRQRDALIRRRNQLRRKPWYAAVAATGLGVTGHGVVLLLDATTSADPRIVAGAAAAAPVVAAAGLASSRERRYQQRLTHAAHHPEQDGPTAPAHRRFLPEVLLGTAGSCGLVYWIATTGMSWLVVLVVLVGTSIIGTRWWRDNPIGPGVPALNPPQADPEPEVPSITTLDDGDTYPKRWKRNNASRHGKAPRSRLTNERRTEYTVGYDVELQPGVQTVSTLRAAVDELTSGLQIPKGSMLVLDDEQGRGAHMAQIKIIEKDPVANIRYYTGPSVTCTRSDGIVHGIGRYGDGEGELDLVMWNDAGMVPTAIIGVTRSGKSSVGNIAITGMLNTGVMNLFYIDPKGTSSPDLESVARVVILGPENASRAPELINAILAARREYASEHRISKFAPSQDLPGWGIVHDEFSELVNRGYTKQGKQWTSLVNTIAAMGMWPVAMNQAMQESKWIDDQCRSAFASQFIVMRMRTTSDKLIPGLELSPSSLPNRKGTGVYVYDDADRSNVPIQFDYVPESDEAYKHPDAPLTTTQAFEQFDCQPALLDVDRQAIESVLGPPNEEGRWIVGGAFATHSFPSEDSATTSATATSAPSRSSGWGAMLAQAVGGSAEPAGADESGLTETQQRVFELIESGTGRRGDIVDELAHDTSSTTVDRALSALRAEGHIQQVKQGRYAVVAEPAST